MSNWREEAKAQRATPGYYYLAKRAMEGTAETLMIVTKLPVPYDEIERLAYEYDKAELARDPSSDYRYFVEPFTKEDIAAYKAKEEASRST